MTLDWAIEVLKPLYKKQVIHLKKAKDDLQARVALEYVRQALVKKEIKEGELIERLSQKKKK